MPRASLCHRASGAVSGGALKFGPAATIASSGTRSAAWSAEWVIDMHRLVSAVYELHWYAELKDLLDAITDELVSDSLVYRYNIEASPDGLQGDEGTFSICSFWYVEALARAGRLDEARLAFEKMLTYANHLGLYAEQIGATGEALGNFPQAFTHLALISAAFNLDRQIG